MTFDEALNRLNSILKEGIDDLRRQPLFKDIKDEILLKIVAADPTADIEKDRKGKYSS